MPLDVRPDHLAMVREILAARLTHNTEVRAFGSRVRGKAKHTSDLDLVIMSEAPTDFLILGLLRDDFSESNLPYKVDLLDWATVDEGFRKIILEASEPINFP